MVSIKKLLFDFLLTCNSKRGCKHPKLKQKVVFIVLIYSPTTVVKINSNITVNNRKLILRQKKVLRNKTQTLSEKKEYLNLENFL